MLEYPRLGEPLPIELAHTILAQAGQPRDGLTTSAQLRGWLRANGQSFPRGLRTTADAQLEQFRALRSAVRALFGAAVEDAQPPAACIALINELSAAAPTYRRLDWRRHAVPASTLVETADPAVSALAIVARATIALLAGSERDLVRLCGAPGCVLFYLKDHPRREWCSAACGNRARVARYYRNRHT